MFTVIHCICKVFTASNYPLDDVLSGMSLTPDDFTSEKPESSKQFERLEKTERRRFQRLQKSQEKKVVLKTDDNEKFEVDLNAPSSFLITEMIEISKTLVASKHTHFDLQKINSFRNDDPLTEIYLPLAKMDYVRKEMNKIKHQYVREAEHFTYKQLLQKKKIFVKEYTHEKFRDTELGKFFEFVEEVQIQIGRRAQFAKEFFDDLEKPKIQHYVEYFNAFNKMLKAFESDVIRCRLPTENISTIYKELHEYVIDNGITDDDFIMYLFKIAKPFEVGRHDKEIKEFKQQTRWMKKLNVKIEGMLENLRQGLIN